MIFICHKRNSYVGAIGFWIYTPVPHSLSNYIIIFDVKNRVSRDIWPKVHHCFRVNTTTSQNSTVYPLIGISGTTLP